MNLLMMLSKNKVSYFRKKKIVQSFRLCFCQFNSDRWATVRGTPMVESHTGPTWVLCWSQSSFEVSEIPDYGVNSDLTPFSTAPYCYHKATENSFRCNSIPSVWIAFQSCTCHKICAIVSCTKSSYDCLIIWIRVKLNFHGI